MRPNVPYSLHRHNRGRNSRSTQCSTQGRRMEVGLQTFQ
jgi:hypothetical protein